MKSEISLNARNERGSQLLDEMFIDKEIEDSDAVAIFGFVQDIVLRLKDEESKEMLISSVLMIGLNYTTSGPLAEQVQQWLKGGE